MTKHFNVTWSPLAWETYLNTLKFILKKWPQQVVTELDDQVEQLIQNLKTHKNLCPPAPNKKNFRRCVISNQTSLVYQIVNNNIEIVTFFDNRSDHQY